MRLRQWSTWFVILLPAAVLRIHNALAFRWGYDGGNHIWYFKWIALLGRFPTPAENYLAWHEPLYYLLAAPLYLAVRTRAEDWIAVKAVAVATALLGFLFVAIAAALAYRLTRSVFAAAVTGATLAYLPIAVFIFQFPTNEALAQTLILGTLFFLSRMPLTQKRGALAGMLVGLAILAKLTGVVLLLAVTVWGIFVAFLERRAGDRHGAATTTRSILIAIAVALFLALPWQVYRATHFGDAFTINNVEASNAVSLGTLPASFFTSLDPRILRDPFWSSGSSSFWSVLYADAWNDYANLFGEVDRADAMSGAEKRLTDGGSWLPLVRDTSGRASILFSVPIALLLLLGLACSVAPTMRERAPHRPLLLLWTFALGTLASLAYNVSRYPYVERGTLKSAFGLAGIACVVVLASVGLFSLPWIQKRPALAAAVYLAFLGVFAVVAWPMLWV